MTTDGLFAEPERTVEAPADAPTQGERRRRRHLAEIAQGRHPLSLALGYSLRLHAEARRDGLRDVADRTPRCGGCVYRVLESHRSRTYAKCHAEPLEVRRPVAAGARPDFGNGDGTYTATEYPRASHGEGTDVAAWWPACTDYTPREETP